MRAGYEGISDFVFMEDSLKKADIILIPGSSRRELITRAVELYKKGYANYILPSGGYNCKLPYNITESHFIKEEAIKLGVPEEVILEENRALNTLENAKFSYEICINNKIKFNKAILICKNYHARRAYITYKIYFHKSTDFIVQPVIDSEQITKENWIYSERKRNKVLGEVRKIGEYFQEDLSFLL